MRPQARQLRALKAVHHQILATVRNVCGGDGSREQIRTAMKARGVYREETKVAFSRSLKKLVEPGLLERLDGAGGSGGSESYRVTPPGEATLAASRYAD